MLKQNPRLQVRGELNCIRDGIDNVSWTVEGN